MSTVAWVALALASLSASVAAQPPGAEWGYRLLDPDIHHVQPGENATVDLTIYRRCGPAGGVQPEQTVLVGLLSHNIHWYTSSQAAHFSSQVCATTPEQSFGVSLYALVPANATGNHTLAVDFEWSTHPPRPKPPGLYPTELTFVVDGTPAGATSQSGSRTAPAPLGLGLAAIGLAGWGGRRSARA